MNQNAYAIYENGVFRPVTLLFDLVEGQRVLITVQPIVELEPEEQARREAELLRRMAAEGALELDSDLDDEEDEEGEDDSDLEGFEPIEIEGPPLSQTIIEERG